MNREETAKILSFVKSHYIGSFKEMSRDEMNGVLTSWQYRFSSLPFDIVFVAVEELVAKSKFPPSVADVAEELIGMYWDNLLYVSGIKHGTIILTDAEKEWILYVDKSLMNFARNIKEPLLPNKEETKMLR